MSKTPNLGHIDFKYDASGVFTNTQGTHRKKALPRQARGNGVAGHDSSYGGLVLTLRVPCGGDGVGRRKNGSIAYRATSRRLAWRGTGKRRRWRQGCALIKSRRAGEGLWPRGGKEDAARHCQEKRKVNEARKIVIVHGSV